ncbi:MAG TPA: hypothetical protein VKU82_07520 [Planctomycetaceae bacterium]|nr:hypothetical protein [Planctomycetaceae bacterium]
MRIRTHSKIAVCGLIALVSELLAADPSKLPAPSTEVTHEGKPPPRELQGLPLVFFDNFETGKAEKWETSDPQAWRVIDQEGNRVYDQFQASQVQTPVRSPFNRSLVKDLFVSDMVLDVKLQSTCKDYDHRDMCLFFGFQDPSHFYYVHLGKKADDHANQIFIVNNEPRKKISTTSTAGTAWNDDWHHARVVRRIETGKIEVYFDDMEKPVMTATDKTFAWGQVGVGTFDDTGHFDDVLVYAKKIERPNVKKDQ